MIDEFKETEEEPVVRSEPLTIKSLPSFPNAVERLSLEECFIIDIPIPGWTE